MEPITWREMTWVGWLNRLLLQWFCIRLAYEIDEDGKKTNFEILKWVVPLTGWKADYKWIGKEPEWEE